MSRGDSIYFKVDVDILDGERIGNLSHFELITYLLGYWRLAVKYRTDRFHPTKNLQFSCKKIAKSLQFSCRSVAKHTQKMYDLGLLIQHEDGSITVEGVRRCHARLEWKEYK